MEILTQLGHLSVEEFLRDYWQKKPVLMRQALPNITPVVSPEELAGLSLETEVESRLIDNEGPPERWRVQHGPLTNADFAKERAHPWTLLVQGVNNWLPDAHELLAKFRFLPRWRIDDLMVSYATEGAGVGAHFDRYDVFLIQGEGQRCWHLGQVCDEQSPLLATESLCLMDDFIESAQYDLMPGDMLYIPPYVAHHGVALSDNCMTYSVGFRAPSHGEILSHFTDYVYARANPSVRLKNSSELTPSAQISTTEIENIKGIIASFITTETVSDWFGRYSTLPKVDQGAINPPEHPLDETELAQLLEEGYGLCRVSEDVCMLYTHQHANQIADGKTRLTLYVNGHAITCEDTAVPLAIALANELVLAVDTVASMCSDETSTYLLLTLYNHGWIYFDNEAG